MKLSIIMPCLNGAKTIERQLKALAKQKWSGSWEVVVSDNGSTDESLDIVNRYKTKIPNLRIVDSSDLTDRAHACNVGIKNSFGEAIAFCDVDDEIEAGWVAAMGEALEKYNFVYCDHRFDKLNSPWIIEAWTSWQNYSAMRHKPFPVAAGCRIGFKRKVIETINGFCVPGFRVEDRDFCWRAQFAGFKLHFVPEAIVQYRFRDSFYSTYRQAYLDGVSGVYLYKKYKNLGMPWRSRKNGLKCWVLVFKRVLSKPTKPVLLRTCADLGFLVGYLSGSIKFRMLIL